MEERQFIIWLDKLFIKLVQVGSICTIRITYQWGKESIGDFDVVRINEKKLRF